MIIDTIKHARQYLGMHHGINKALEYLMSVDIPKLAEGRNDVDKDTYVLLSHPTTRNTGGEKYEAHRNYIDVQYLLSGEEYIYFDQIENLIEDTPYNPEKDCILFTGPRKGLIQMLPGTFAIFFPNDAHMPLVSQGKEFKLTKLVVKVRV